MKRSMNCMMKAVMMAFLCLAIVSSATASYIEQFTDDNAGWNYGYGTDFSSPLLPATYANSGGNPGGCIGGSVENLYAIWTYETAPYGNIAGQTLTIDTLITDSGYGTAQFYVGRGGTFYIDGTWSIADDTSWTTHTTTLDAAHFTPWTGRNNNLYTLSEVLQAPDDIGIFFGGSLASGTGTLYADNFGTVPEPGSLAMLAGVALTALLYWRQRQA